MGENQQFNFVSQEGGAWKKEKNNKNENRNEETEKTAAIDKGDRTCSTCVLRETLPFMWTLKKKWLLNIM